MIIPDPDLRAQFGQRMTALGLSPNRFGLLMAEAAYSPEGADWVDESDGLYLEGKQSTLFDATIAEIKGVNVNAAGRDISGLGRFFRHWNGASRIHPKGRKGCTYRGQSRDHIRCGRSIIFAV